MYFETARAQRSPQRAHQVDQQTLEAAPTQSPSLPPMLVNTVVGFIGPEYLYDGKQIARAASKTFLWQAARPSMGCDVCYTNHAEADQDDMDTLLTLLGAAGRQLHHGVPRRRRDAQLPEHQLS